MIDRRTKERNEDSKKDVPDHIKDWFSLNDVDYLDVIFKVDGVVWIIKVNDVLIFKNGWDNRLKNITD